MRKVLRALGSGIGITVMVAVVLSACLWFLGGFVAFGEARPFETLVGALVGLAALWIVALIVILVILLTAKKRDETLANDIVSAPDPVSTGDEIVGAELSEMRSKLKAALARLRKSRVGRRSLYELPWYIIIGPPGAGKTTAIVNSGLQFPLADEMGKAALAGVGGTRNCDWWFTNEAVLVDTAGRYTTQESDAEADNAAWLGFLGLLKRHRRRQPINGALVAISLSDLSLQDELTQKAHAGAVRRRLHELRERLGVRFPVYVLFTKADLIAGFTEFFDTLSKDDREQVWGFTLPLRPGRGEASPVGGFDEEFGLLMARLNAQSLERIQTETDPQRRSLIASFPAQVASVRGVARDFLAEVFQENRFEHRQMLRGVYFTSGTQEGAPIDRLMMGMARTFGIGRQAIGTGRGTGRSYFLTWLFEGVIFREAGLVSADDRVERRYRWMQRAAYAAAVIAALSMGALWLQSFLGNRQMIAGNAAQVEAFRQAAAQIPGSPVADSDLPLVVPALDILRGIAEGTVAGQSAVPAGLGWGLYQGRVIRNDARLSYRAALNRHLLPRLLLRLEEFMQANANAPESLHEALKVYLMLGQMGPLARDQITEWFRADWELVYPGIARDPLRQALAAHLDALTGQPMQAIELNNDVVAAVREIVTTMPQAQRVYNGIVSSEAATALPRWRLTDIGGPNLARAVTRSSGKALNEGIEGIYTYEGFHAVFLDQVGSVAARIKRDAWVLGEAAGEPTETALIALARDVLDLYYNDFIQRYDTLLGDIDIIPMESLSHAAEVTNVLSGPTSPIVNILNAVNHETRLTEDRPAPGAAAVADAASGALGGQAGAMARSRLSLQSQIFIEALQRASAQPGQPAPPKPGAYVEDRFSWLNDLVTRPEGGASPLEGLIGTLTEVYQELNRLNFAGGVSAGQTGDSTAIARFVQEAGRIEGPLQRWATQIATGSSGITAEGTRAGLSARWQASVLPFCEQATKDVYPFNRRARADIAMKDFATLFGPGGQIDAFFAENLANIVDTRARPWAWKRLNDADLGISPAVLTQFQMAAEIRDAFFGTAPQPEVKFQITPEALSEDARAMTLEIDGTSVTYRHGDGVRPVAVTWPGAVGLARMQFDPPRQGSEAVISRDGPWGWFRLLDAAEIRRTNVSDRSRLIFNFGGRTAIFQMQSGSVVNPFALPALSKFSCPKSF